MYERHQSRRRTRLYWQSLGQKKGLGRRQIGKGVQEGSRSVIAGPDSPGAPNKGKSRSWVVSPQKKKRKAHNNWIVGHQGAGGLVKKVGWYRTMIA